MDKKTLLGLVAMALVFIGFAYLNGKDQQRYQEELARLKQCVADAQKGGL